MSGTSLVEITDLRVSFGVASRAASARIQAVRGVSLSVAQGEILGVVGESGSGKSVTTSAISGLLPAHAEVRGSITYAGRELLGLPFEELRAYRGTKIGMIFQEPGRSYDPLQTIGDAFVETLRNKDPAMTKAQCHDRAAALLSDVGLDGAARRLRNYPHQFSGGQLQRIGIALSLAQGCELLIADEPTTALDVTIQAQIVGLLQRLRKERGISIIFISHNIDVVSSISDRVLVMYGGLAMEEGPVREVLSRPRHPYTRALLAAAPRFGEHYSASPLLSIPGKVPDPASPEPGCPFAPRCPRVSALCVEAIPALRRVPGIERGRYRCVLSPEDAS